jgi:hypothetical protein
MQQSRLIRYALILYILSYTDSQIIALHSDLESENWMDNRCYQSRARLLEMKLLMKNCG